MTERRVPKLVPPYAVAAAVVGVLAIAVALTVAPGFPWRGTAIWEPCERRVEEQYGKISEVHVLRDDVYLDWLRLPPSWMCPLSNGDEVTP